jgi:hypothetical protein
VARHDPLPPPRPAPPLPPHRIAQQAHLPHFLPERVADSVVAHYLTKQEVWRTV